MKRCLLAASVLIAMIVAGCATRNHPTPVFEPEPQSIWGTPSQQPAQTQGQTPIAATGVRSPFLWVVRAGNVPSMLFGTIEGGVSFEEAITPARRRDLRSARRIIVAVDNRTTNQQSMMDAARGGDTPMDQLMPSLQWHDLSNELNTMLPPGELRNMRPWFALRTLQGVRLGALEQGNAVPMDVAIANFARQHAVELRALETQADVWASYGSVADETTLGLLRGMVADTAGSQNRLRALVSAYRNGDENRTGAFLLNADELAQAPDFFSTVFFERNDRWMESIQSEVDQGGVFIALDLRHLLGPEGIVGRLQSAGYDIQRVR